MTSSSIQGRRNVVVSASTENSGASNKKPSFVSVAKALGLAVLTVGKPTKAQRPRPSFEPSHVFPQEMLRPGAFDEMFDLADLNKDGYLDAQEVSLSKDFASLYQECAPSSVVSRYALAGVLYYASDIYGKYRQQIEQLAAGPLDSPVIISEAIGRIKEISYANFFLNISGIYRPQGNEASVLVIDSFNACKRPSDGTRYHGLAVQYVLEDNLNFPEEVKVHRLDRAGSFAYLQESMLEDLAQLNAMVASIRAPAVVHMSYGLSLGTTIDEVFRNISYSPEREAFLGYAQDKKTDVLFSVIEKRYGVLYQLIQDAVSALTRSGAVVVQASGNAGSQQRVAELGFRVPAWALDKIPDMHYSNNSAPGVIVVGSSQTSDPYSQPSNSTTLSSAVDVAACGQNVTITPEGDVSNGTSFSAPQVSACVADMLVVNPSLSPAKVEALVKKSTGEIYAYPTALGAGVMNCERALELAQEAGK